MPVHHMANAHCWPAGRLVQVRLLVSHATMVTVQSEGIGAAAAGDAARPSIVAVVAATARPARDFLIDFLPVADRLWNADGTRARKTATSTMATQRGHWQVAPSDRSTLDQDGWRHLTARRRLLGCG